MKILHTSDWHIGKRLGNVYRLEEQRKVLDEICAIAHKKSVDAVVVAGDVFDVYNPPVDAIELVYSQLKKLSLNGKRPVVVIAGNHDSPDRIEAPNALARDNGIFLFGYPKSQYTSFTNDLLFTVSKTAPGFVEFTLASQEKLRVIVAPFANEHRMKEAFITDESKTLTDSLRLFWKQIADTYCDNSGVNICLGHHLILPKSQTEIEEPDNEKPIQAISELLPPNVIPSQIQYVALGHLHSNRIVSHNPHIQYSGSICAYSFSEAHHKKHITIVTCNSGEKAEIEKVELHTPRDLVRVSCSGIEEAREWLENNQDCYVELTIHVDTYIRPVDIKSLHAIHDGIIYIIPLMPVQQTHESSSVAVSHNRSMQDLFAEYFESKNGVKPSKEICSIFNEIVSITE
ncbi:MAG: exonuclease SbcCD subunit D [Bacteroidales bacterium]